MLILTRSVGEVICIGNDIKLVVVSIKGNQVRLGVQAPRHVTVDRQEIADRKAQGHRIEAEAEADAEAEVLR